MGTDQEPGRFRARDRDDVLRAILDVPLLIALAFLVGILLSGVGAAALVGPDVTLETIPPLTNAVVTALQFVGFLAVGLVYLDYRDDWSLVALRWPTPRDVGWVVLGLVALFVLNYAYGVVLTTLGIEPAANQAVESGREQPTLLLYMAAVSILFVAPGEELLFRGLVQGLLRRVVGVGPAILVASILFGVVHWIALVGAGGGEPTLSGILAYVAIAAGLGLVLGTVYEWTKTLAVPVVIHGLWNAVQFLWVYAAETGAFAGGA